MKQLLKNKWVFVSCILMVAGVIYAYNDAVYLFQFLDYKSRWKLGNLFLCGMAVSTTISYILILTHKNEDK